MGTLTSQSWPQYPLRYHETSSAVHKSPETPSISQRQQTDPEKGTASQKAPSFWLRLAVDWWLWELAAASLCLGNIALICGVLIAYDQKPVPQLPKGITLNAVISVLATIAKSTLMVSVAAAISQDKWLWFLKKPRRLNVIDTFDDASRGPFGSFTLLLSRCGSLSTWIAAFVTLCAVGFEPFLQQLVSFPSRTVPVHGLTASILTPTAYNESVIGNLGGADLQLSALIGCFGGASGAVPQPVCPGGNCAWPIYHSLSMCTKCTDVTAQVSTSGEQYNVNITEIIANRGSHNVTADLLQTYATTYFLPTGRSVDGFVQLSLLGSDQVQYSVDYPRRIVWPLNIDGTPDSIWTYSWGRETYAGIDGPLLAMGYLDLDLNDDASRLELKEAMECSLTPCVHEFDSSIVGGKLIANVVATDYGNVSINDASPYPRAGWTATVNATDYSIVDIGIANAQGWATLVIQSLRMALEGNTTYSVSASCEGLSDCTPYPSTGFSMTGGPWSSSGQQAIDGTDNFTTIVEGVTKAMTGRFQQLSDSHVNGVVLQSQTFVDVRWIWITYPLTLVFLGILTVLATILQTKRAGMAIWKSSALPLLSRYVGHQERGLSRSETGPRPNGISSLSETARHEKVQLLQEEDLDGTGIWVLRREKS